MRLSHTIPCLAFAMVLAAGWAAGSDRDPASRTPAGAKADKPSRAASKGCAWEKLRDAHIGLSAWIERCDYGFRKIDFFVEGNALKQRYSDGGEPYAVVEVLDLLSGETAQQAMRRIFLAHTEAAVARRCVLASYRGDKPPAGVRRFNFVANAAYRKKLRAESDPNEVGDPACGDWGEAPDGIQYFEVRDAANTRKILFVRVGQDQPLFDEKSLTLNAAP